MCAAHVASMTGFGAYPTLLPRLQDEWGMNNSQAGFVSGMFFAGYMAAVPVLTGLTDRFDARRIYFVSSIAIAFALAGFALLAQGSASASLLQLLAGVGIAGTYMPGLRALTDNVSGTGAQSRAVAFYTAVFGFGTSLSILFAGWIAASLDWRWHSGWLRSGRSPRERWSSSDCRRGIPCGRRRPHARFRPVLKNRVVQPYIFGYACTAGSCSARAPGWWHSSCSHRDCSSPTARVPLPGRR